MIDWAILGSTALLCGTAVTVASLRFAERVIGRGGVVVRSAPDLPKAALSIDRMPKELRSRRIDGLLKERVCYENKIEGYIRNGFEDDRKRCKAKIDEIDRELVAFHEVELRERQPPSQATPTPPLLLQNAANWGRDD